MAPDIAVLVVTAAIIAGLVLAKVFDVFWMVRSISLRQTAVGVFLLDIGVWLVVYGWTERGDQ